MSHAFDDPQASRNGRGFVRIPSRAGLMIGLAGWIALAGCGGSGNPPTVPISGTITYKGAPLTSGNIRFNPVDPKAGRPAEGTIGPDGRFAMATFRDGDGAMAGDYTISIIPEAEDPNMLAKDRAAAAKKKVEIPEKYMNPKTSGLKETVTAGKPRTDLKLELVD